MKTFTLVCAFLLLACTSPTPTELMRGRDLAARWKTTCLDTSQHHDCHNAIIVYADGALAKVAEDTTSGHVPFTLVNYYAIQGDTKWFARVKTFVFPWEQGHYTLLQQVH